MAALTKEQVYKLALNRMNYTWEPDEAQSANVNAAIEEAEALLRARAGSPDLDLTGPEYRGLLIECVWYLANNRRAEFEEDYRAEIVNLRLAEGFGCGKEESTVLILPGRRLQTVAAGRWKTACSAAVRCTLQGAHGRRTPQF